MSQICRQVPTASFALLWIHWFWVAQIPLSPMIWSMWAKFQMPLAVFRVKKRRRVKWHPHPLNLKALFMCPSTFSPLNKTFCAQERGQSPAGTIPRVPPASWQLLRMKSSDSQGLSSRIKTLPHSQGVAILSGIVNKSLITVSVSGIQPAEETNTVHPIVQSKTAQTRGAALGPVITTPGTMLVFYINTLRWVFQALLPCNPDFPPL